MNREKYAKYKSNLPSDFTEIEIAGGCHAYFGMYGEQDGDGVPTLSAAEQIHGSNRIRNMFEDVHLSNQTI